MDFASLLSAAPAGEAPPAGPGPPAVVAVTPARPGQASPAGLGRPGLGLPKLGSTAESWEEGFASPLTAGIYRPKLLEPLHPRAHPGWLAFARKPTTLLAATPPPGLEEDETV